MDSIKLRVIHTPSNGEEWHLRIGPDSAIHIVFKELDELLELLTVRTLYVNPYLLCFDRFNHLSIDTSWGLVSAEYYRSERPMFTEFKEALVNALVDDACGEKLTKLD